MIEIDDAQKKLRLRLMNDQKFHDTIVSAVRERFDASERAINKRFQAWREAERQHLAYVDFSDKDQEGKKLFPWARSIVVPYSYAVLQTRVVYFYLAFGTKNPIVPILGNGPGDVIPAKLMEVIHGYQIRETKALACLYCWLQDTERYGLGILKNLWMERREWKWLTERHKVGLLGMNIMEYQTKERKKVLVYEGNYPFNVSPYNFRPDPRAAVSDIEHMEYCGEFIQRQWSHLKWMEDQGEYFNIKRINKKSSTDQDANVSTTVSNVQQQSDLARIAGVSTIDSTAYVDGKDRGYADLEEMYVRWVPDDYGLSKNKSPEEWIVTVANQRTIIKCEPSMYSGFPYYVIESNYDYASPFNLGTIEMIRGLQDTLSWLYNSHMENVRKIINDSLVVDPSMIELKDLTSGAPAKIIRLKEAAWGDPNATATAVRQLQVNDITRTHIQDSQYVIGLIQRVSASTDNLMGMVEEVKRTATETSSTLNLATSRLKMIAQLYYILGIQPWHKAMAFNNQSFLSEKRYYRITDQIAEQLFGMQKEVLKNRVLIKPEDIYGNFDYDFPNFDLPYDKANMARVWTEILGMVSQNQMLAQKYDVDPIFREMIYNMGVTNINDFQIKPKTPQIVPDEQAKLEEQKGNLVPIDQYSNSIGMGDMLTRMMGESKNGGNREGESDLK